MSLAEKQILELEKICFEKVWLDGYSLVYKVYKIDDESFDFVHEYCVSEIGLSHFGKTKQEALFNLVNNSYLNHFIQPMISKILEE